MNTSGFWGYFEESAIEVASHCGAAYGTQTGRHERVDQERMYLSEHMKTIITNTREESDQDLHGERHCAIPIPCHGSQTSTRQREEPDQDESCYLYVAVPRQSVCGTRTTLTEQREESDQDVSSRGYRAIPVNARD